jgi:hypothetical protein
MMKEAANPRLNANGALLRSVAARSGLDQIATYFNGPVLKLLAATGSLT